MNLILVGAEAEAADNPDAKEAARLALDVGGLVRSADAHNINDDPRRGIDSAPGGSSPARSPSAALPSTATALVKVLEERDALVRDDAEVEPKRSLEHQP